MKSLKLKPIISLVVLLSLVALLSSTDKSATRKTTSSTITTMQFAQIINDKDEEARHYYLNNWLILRKQAMAKDYIESYDLFETDYSEDSPFNFVLITTFKDQAQYEAREDNFGELIEARGKLNLLNEVQPNDFRKTVFIKREAKKLSH